MDKKGFNAIGNALDHAGIEATVTPEPEQYEDARYVTVETSADIQPSRMLNALAVQGLMHDDPESEFGRQIPYLKVLGIQPGSATFEDQN